MNFNNFFKVPLSLCLAMAVYAPPFLLLLSHQITPYTAVFQKKKIMLQYLLQKKNTTDYNKGIVMFMNGSLNFIPLALGNSLSCASAPPIRS